MKTLCLLLAAAVNIALMACDAADAPTPPPTYTPAPTPGASASMSADERIEQRIAYNDQSFVYYDKGDYAGVLAASAKAIDAFNKAIEIAPNYQEFHHNLGFALMEKGVLHRNTLEYDKSSTAFNKALDAFSKVIELDPNHPYALYALYNQGLVYHEIGDFKDAIAAFRQVLKNNPSDADAYYNLGNAYYEIGEEDKAIVSYGKAAELRSQ